MCSRGGVRGIGEKQTPTDSADSAFEDLALRDTCMRAEICKPPLDDGVEKTGDFNNEVPKGYTAKGAGESMVV